MACMSQHPSSGLQKQGPAGYQLSQSHVCLAPILWSPAPGHVRCFLISPLFCHLFPNASPRRLSPAFSYLSPLYLPPAARCARLPWRRWRAPAAARAPP